MTCARDWIMISDIRHRFQPIEFTIGIVHFPCHKEICCNSQFFVAHVAARSGCIIFGFPLCWSLEKGEEWFLRESELFLSDLSCVVGAFKIWSEEISSIALMLKCRPMFFTLRVIMH